MAQGSPEFPNHAYQGQEHAPIVPEAGQSAPDILGQPEQLPHDGGLNAPEPHPPKDVPELRALPTTLLGEKLVIPEFPPVVLQRMVAAGKFTEQSAQMFLREYRTWPGYPWKKELLEYEAEQQRAQPHDQAATHEPQAGGEQPDDEEIDLSWERERVGWWVEDGYLSRDEARALLRGKDWDDDSQWNE